MVSLRKRTSDLANRVMALLECDLRADDPTGDLARVEHAMQSAHPQFFSPNERGAGAFTDRLRDCLEIAMADEHAPGFYPLDHFRLFGIGLPGPLEVLDHEFIRALMFS